MKRISAILCLLAMLTFAGCGRHRFGDFPAAINVNGTVYYSTDTAVAVQLGDNKIRSTSAYVETGTPEKDGEKNFGKGTDTLYALQADDTVVVLIQNEWIQFKAK